VEPIVVAFATVNAAALLVLPRRWAPLPLILGACYMTRGQAIEVGVASLTVVRLLIAAGLLRLLVRREWVDNDLNALDYMMIAWGFWMIASVALHPSSTSFVVRVRDVYEGWGLFLLFRVFCRSPADIRQISKIIALILVPIGMAMLVEQSTGVNPFYRFGGVDEYSVVRNGIVRAQGPFAHAILAGTIGGVCLPLVMGLWKATRTFSIVGIAACSIMIITSASSGPILAAGAGVGVFLLWPLRRNMRLVRWSAVALYVVLEIVMNQPAYFIITYVDLIGGSTSWYRAALIREAFAHLGEWWLVGTDYTRHWMASGIPADPNHVDIVNHYISMGVVGGVLLMGLFIGLFVRGFSQVGRGMQLHPQGRDAISCWAAGASLFAHTVTCLSISYFDHSIMFLYLTLATTTAAIAVTPEVVGHPQLPIRRLQFAQTTRRAHAARASARRSPAMCD
jgi:hypothetical protein